MYWEMPLIGELGKSPSRFFEVLPGLKLILIDTLLTEITLPTTVAWKLFSQTGPSSELEWELSQAKMAPTIPHGNHFNTHMVQLSTGSSAKATLAS